MRLFIKRFKISKLFGIYDVDIPFTNNINIFVGENGLGKTTVLNTLNYILQCDSKGLSSVDFDTIVLELGNGEQITIKHDEIIKEDITNNRNIIVHGDIYNEYFNQIKNLIIDYLVSNESLSTNEVKNIIFKNISSSTEEFDDYIPPYFIDKYINTILDKSKKNITNSWEYKIKKYMKEYDNIIYLPTYRRIEEDFNSYINSKNSKDSNKLKKNFSYLQFGMDDVKETIDLVCKTLKDNTNEGFKEMTSNLLTYYVNIMDDESSNDELFDNDTSKLDIVFSRLAEKISKDVKNRIEQVLSEKVVLKDKYNRYLFTIIHELNKIYDKNKQIDDNLENFKNVCNEYLLNKEVCYDKIKIECVVKQKNSKKKIELKNLSSGEKQLVSLFSKLYLNQNEKNIILFDEPELSLSIIWQKKIVPDIINSNKCSFMLMVTHSPFIFENEYIDNTIDIGNYIKVNE